LNTDPNCNDYGTPLPRPLYLDYKDIPNNTYTPNLKCPTIGSIGFALGHKNWEKIITLVEKEFDEAIINLHMPNSYYCDQNGNGSRSHAMDCRNNVTKPGIKLNITHNLFTNDELINFLNENDLNIFMYDELRGSGCSSALDFALCVNRPIAISNSYMFRHVYDDSICIDKHSLADIMKNGTQHLDKYRKSWSHKNLACVFYDIFYKVK